MEVARGKHLPGDYQHKVLGGAFLTARNSRLGVRNSEEHIIANKLLENQLEELRSNAVSDATAFSQGSAFCMYNEEPVSPSSGNCNVDESGTAVPATTQPSYSISVTDCFTAGCPDYINGSNLYSATITWAQVGSGNRTGNINVQVVSVGQKSCISLLLKLNRVSKQLF